MRYLNLYRVDRLYGGPEEGGWWYDAGEPLASVPFFLLGLSEAAVSRPDEHDQFRRACEDLTAQFADHAGERDRFKVNGGPDVVVYWEDHMACSFPEVRPHYE